jgi:hypothetical protein
MFTASLRNAALAAAGSMLVYAAGGCGADWASGLATQEGAQTNQDNTSAAEDTAASEAGQLLRELETILGQQDAGAAGDGLNALLAALASAAGSAPSLATSQPATPAHPFRQLRAEIHTLRHSLTREQVAQLLLNALAAANTADGSATTGFDLAARVQNLLASLRAAATQPTTP